MEYDNNMTGVLFENDRKKTKKHPDKTGSAEVNGVEYWLSAWEKQGAKGTFLSLAFTPKEEKPEQQSEPVPDGDTDF